MLTVLLLVASNVLMTVAWYGHLRFPDRNLALVVLISWLIAFFEYCLAVPANRIGYFQAGYSAAQLKIIQEAVTLSVFIIFAVLVLGERVRWNYFAAVGCMIAAVYFVFRE
ncbi:MAG: DMT family protein [Rhodospirillaceae bacterium]